MVVAVVGNRRPPPASKVVDVALRFHPAPEPVSSSAVTASVPVVERLYAFSVTPGKARVLAALIVSEPPEQAGLKVPITAAQSVCGLLVGLSESTDPTLGAVR